MTESLTGHDTTKQTLKVLWRCLRSVHFLATVIGVVVAVVIVRFTVQPDTDAKGTKNYQRQDFAMIGAAAAVVLREGYDAIKSKKDSEADSTRDNRLVTRLKEELVRSEKKGRESEDTGLLLAALARNAADLAVSVQKRDLQLSRLGAVVRDIGGLHRMAGQVERAKLLGSIEQAVLDALPELTSATRVMRLELRGSRLLRGRAVGRVSAFTARTLDAYALAHVHSAFSDAGAAVTVDRNDPNDARWINEVAPPDKDWQTGLLVPIFANGPDGFLWLDPVDLADEAEMRTALVTGILLGLALHER